MADLHNNTDLNRYEIKEAGQTVFAEYETGSDRMVITWVESPMSLRGTGAAGRLMALVAEEARRTGRQITPICGYAAAWLRASKVYRDLLD